MRGCILLLAVVSGLTFASATADEGSGTGVTGTGPPEIESFVQESRAMVKAFSGDLKSELQAAIAIGGPVHAIPVCNVRAPEIAATPSPGQWAIGRTSHKIRNPSNAPDDWETEVLEMFRERAAAGESLNAMEATEFVAGDAGATYRYMKAIPVGQVCLTCHGTDVEPELKAEIGTYYPDDRATGFALGELRGAFTITKTSQD